ncbi:MAG: hypothetical protein ACPHZ6_05920, partial [Poseidonia sp.]
DSRGIVDFVDGRDAKCILRWPSGKCLVELGDGKVIQVRASAHSMTVRYLADEEDALPGLPMIEDHSGRDGDGGDDDDDDDDDDDEM